MCHGDDSVGANERRRPDVVVPVVVDEGGPRPLARVGEGRVSGNVPVDPGVSFAAGNSQ